MENSTRGQAPYGFRWSGGQLLPEKTEAETRRMAFELFLKLKSMGAVARELNTAGRVSRRGGRWSDVQVARILNCPSAMGRYGIGRSESTESGKRVATRSEERVVMECDMIVTKAVWEKTQAILLKVSKGSKKLGGKEEVSLFAGMVSCRCGGKMKWVSEGAKLDCPECHAKIPVTDLESVFAEDFYDLISQTPELMAAMSADSEARGIHAELAGLKASLHDARSRREGTENLLSNGAITRKRFEELHPPLEKEVRQLETRLGAQQAKLAGSPPVPLGLADWKKQWMNWPPQRKRQILAAFVERITLHESEIEITYLLSDFSSKEAIPTQQTTSPTNHRQIVTNPAGPQYIRLPKQGEKCPITGLSRAKLNELILPNERNHFNPPVASKSLRKAGAQKGVRLVLLESLLAYLSGMNPK